MATKFELQAALEKSEREVITRGRTIERLRLQLARLQPVGQVQQRLEFESAPASRPMSGSAHTPA